MTVTAKSRENNNDTGEMTNVSEKDENQADSNDLQHKQKFLQSKITTGVQQV